MEKSYTKNWPVITEEEAKKELSCDICNEVEADLTENGVDYCFDCWMIAED